MSYQNLVSGARNGYVASASSRSTSTPLPVDESVAISYGRLTAAVVDSGRQPQPRALDLLIAATAHAHGARLYTRNFDDFAGLEDHLNFVAI